MRYELSPVEMGTIYREALVENQIDNRHEELWIDMVCGVAHSYLPTDPVVAFRGYLCRSHQTHEANRILMLLVKGYRKILRHYEDSSERTVAAKRLIEMALDAFPYEFRVPSLN